MTESGQEKAAKASKTERVGRTLFRADDRPPYSTAILFGIQQVMVTVSSLLTVPFIISNELCPGRDVYIIRTKLISSAFAVSGISTIIQTLFGTRLALLQGTAFAYIPSVQAFMQLTEYKCHASESDIVDPSVYENKFATMQGCLMIASTMIMVLGATGLVGAFAKFIGPLTVSPLMLLLVLSVVDVCVQQMAKHWVAIVQGVGLFGTVLYLADVAVPVPAFKKGKFTVVRANIFGQYPYLIAILVSWGFCLFLTLADLEPPDSAARLDKNETIAVIRNSPWISTPYPGKFGRPKFHAGLCLAFIVSAMTTVLESIGDYHAAARVSEERAPPTHAINRGMLAEGFGCFLSGLLGPGIGMTTHLENVGVIGITRMASRLPMLMAGVALILLGIFTKVGALLSTIPDPLIGGVLAGSMGMIGGVAIANFHGVDMKSSRNVAVIGFAIMVGMIIPTYFKTHPVSTGVESLDESLNVLLTIPMFIGGVTGCFLDNTVPGVTREQRGLRVRGAIPEALDGRSDPYVFPPSVMARIQKYPLLRVLPFLPKPKTVSVHPEIATSTC